MPDFVEQTIPIVELVERVRSENRRLRAALKPFAAAVFNDNGDMTVTPCAISDYAKAYFVMRDLEK